MTNPLTAGLPPVHPGDILREDVLPAVRVPKVRIAKELGISRQSFDDLLKGKSSLSTLMALKLERLFGGSAEMWCNLQRDYDLAIARHEKADELNKIEALEEAA